MFYLPSETSSSQNSRMKWHKSCLIVVNSGVFVCWITMFLLRKCFVASRDWKKKNTYIYVYLRLCAAETLRYGRNENWQIRGKQQRVKTNIYRFPSRSWSNKRPSRLYRVAMTENVRNGITSSRGVTSDVTARCEKHKYCTARAVSGSSPSVDGLSRVQLGQTSRLQKPTECSIW